MEDLILEVGGVYVFKDKESKSKWMDNHCMNEDYFDLHYKEGFTIDEVDGDGDGYVERDTVIGLDEYMFFKKKEPSPKDNTTFTKSDLKDGMLVEVREPYNGDGLYVVIGEYLLSSTGHNELGVYKEDLTCKEDVPCWDIIRVYSVDKFNTLQLERLNKKLIWERSEEDPPEVKPDYSEELEALKEKMKLMYEELSALEEKMK